MRSEALRSFSEGRAKEGRSSLKYVYLLRSIADPSKIYTGLTDDPIRRLGEHNAGKSTFTARHVPWKIEVTVGFEREQHAVKFERYLKTGSGIAFARRHLW